MVISRQAEKEAYLCVYVCCVWNAMGLCECSGEDNCSCRLESNFVCRSCNSNIVVCHLAIVLQLFVVTNPPSFLTA